MRKIDIRTEGLLRLVPATLMITAVISNASAAATPDPAPPTATRLTNADQPPLETLVILVRSTISAMNHANISDNYSVLHALGSPDFQANNPPDRLRDIFTAFRSNHIDVAPILLIEPELAGSGMSADGRGLRIAGHFPSRPLQVDFDLTFERSAHGWVVQGIEVHLNPVPSDASERNPSR